MIEQFTCGINSRCDVFLLSFFLGKSRFMVLHHGCIYYFKETDSSAPKGKFALNGYRYITIILRHVLCLLLLLLSLLCLV